MDSGPHGVPVGPAGGPVLARHHRIPGPAFDRISAGDFDAGDVGLLWATQRSRRLLLIWGLVNLVGERWPGSELAVGARAAFDTLAATRRLWPAGVDQVLSYPTVGAWLHRSHRRMNAVELDQRAVSVERDVGHLAAVAAAAAYLVRQPFDLPVLIHSGQVAFPGLGVAIVAAPNLHGWGRAHFAGSGPVAIATAGRTATVRLDERSDTRIWMPVRRISAGKRERLTITVDDIDPYRDCGVFAAAGRLDPTALASWTRRLDRAWSVLEAVDPARARAMAAGLAALVPIVETGDFKIAGATCSDAVGAVALSVPPSDPNECAVVLIHEFHHSVLNALLDAVPLHDDRSEASYFAPWRSDPRPINTLLQGIYAFLGVGEFWARRLPALTGGTRMSASVEFAWCREAIRRAVAEARRSGCLTDLGERFLTGIDACLGKWSAVPVPADAEAWAQAMNDDAQMLWRMCNIEPDPDGVAIWATQYVRGRACSGGPPRTGPPRAKGPGRGRHRRSVLLHKHLRAAPMAAGRASAGLTPVELPSPGQTLADHTSAGPMASEPGKGADRDSLGGPVHSATVGDDDTDSDQLLITGRFGEAEQGYLQQLGRDARDPSAFAGLLLARILSGCPRADIYRSQPELLHSLFVGIATRSGRSPDIAHLADWLGRSLARPE